MTVTEFKDELFNYGFMYVNNGKIHGLEMMHKKYDLKITDYYGIDCICFYIHHENIEIYFKYVSTDDNSNLKYIISENYIEILKIINSIIRKNKIEILLKNN
jgi:hypothetical protein